MQALFPGAALESEGGSMLLGVSGGSIVNLFSGHRERLIDAAVRGGWHIFLVDERHVRLDHADSNYGLLKAKVFPDPIQLHGLRPDLELDECAFEYGERFARVCDDVGRDRFDMIVMGVGPDGHCASLFPGHPGGEFPAPRVDASRTTDHPNRIAGGEAVIPVRNAPKPPPNRISFTGAALASSRRIRLVVMGEAKRGILNDLRRAPERYPAGRILLGHPDAAVVADQSALS
ncbi:MAG: 6-phosphogluconolactonase [Leptospirales bacterium]|jgi:6-phosphogluconolactonase